MTSNKLTSDPTDSTMGLIDLAEPNDSRQIPQDVNQEESKISEVKNMPTSTEAYNDALIAQMTNEIQKIDSPFIATTEKIILSKKNGNEKLIADVHEATVIGDDGEPKDIELKYGPSTISNLVKHKGLLEAQGCTFHDARKIFNVETGELVTIPAMWIAPEGFTINVAGMANEGYFNIGAMKVVKKE